MKKTEKETELSQNGTAAASPEPLVPLAPSTVSPEQFEELKQRATKAEEHWDRLLRTTADFDNYKKRAAREKQEAIKFANESLLLKLVPVLDSFDMALSAAQSSQDPQANGIKSLQAGIAMVHQQFKTALLEAGLEEIDATGKTFDPNLHEAVSERETSEAPEGQVAQQLRKGYKLRERLLRPASVIVARQPASPTP